MTTLRHATPPLGCAASWPAPDAYGNSYYRLKRDRPSGRGGGRFSRERAAGVIYKGEPEGSKVPAGMACPGCTTRSTRCPASEWPRYAWEKPHQPNLTGTPEAYHPTRLGAARGSPRPRDRRLRAIAAGNSPAGPTSDARSRGIERQCHRDRDGRGRPGRRGAVFCFLPIARASCAPVPGLSAHRRFRAYRRDSRR